MRVLLKLLRGWQMSLELPTAQIERKNNALNCSGKSKLVHCNHDRLSHSTLRMDVEWADAWKESQR